VHPKCVAFTGIEKGTNMLLHKKAATTVFVLAFALALANCGGTTHPAPPPPAAPTLSASYSFTLLPPLPQGSAAQALVINSSGVAAGFSTVNGLPEATEWVNGQPIDLGPGSVLAINDSGDLAGFVVGPDGHNEALHWVSGSAISTVVGPFAGFDSSVANGIDTDGTLTGTAFNSFDVSQMEGWESTPAGGPVLVPQFLESFAIHGGEMVGLAPNFDAASVTITSTMTSTTDLGVSGDALAINSLGDIVGFTFGDTTQAFLWRQGALSLLGTGNTLISTALGINSSDLVVGYVEQASGNVRVSRMGMPRILNPPVGANVFAMGWSKGEGIVQLATRVPSVGIWLLNYADGINDTGQIVGTASSTLGNGTVTTQGFILGPQ
jgi:uncharacterized membrane protein